MDSSGSQEKKPVPRFSSFKLPQAPPPEADRPSERHSREHARRDGSFRHRSSRHRSHRDRPRSGEHRREHQEHHRSHRKDHHAHVAPEHRTGSKRVVKETQNEQPDLFVIDRKGDRFNLLYGTLYRYSVPEYHRFGRGSVLGLPPRYKIDRDTIGENTLVVRTDAGQTDSAKLKSKNILSGLRKQKGNLLRIRPQRQSDETADLAKDYLPLNLSARRRQPGFFGDGDSDDDKYAYRSIHGKAKPEDYLPSDEEAAPETGSEDEGFRVDLNEEIKQANVELSRKTEQDATDIGAWLQLIDHQDFLISGAEGESRPMTYAEKMSLADIKLSLYEKALKRIEQGPAKERLLLGLLEEGSKLWDTKKLSEQWQKTLKSNSQFIGLWVKYLDFRQTQFLDFTYERCLATFIDCLKLNQSGPNGPDKAYVQMYLFLRFTLFIRETGFVEHAVGLWQAVLELTFFRPEGLDLHKNREKALSEFVEFWESEVARIGEPGAKGWKSGKNSAIDTQAPSPIAPVIPKSIFKSWTACEKERTIRARLPARSLVESEDDDPYRVVIWSDLQEILSIFETDSADVLLEAFLYFCHLPPLTTPSNAQTTSRWAGDNFVRNGFMGAPDATLDDWFRPADNTESPAATPVLFPHPNFLQTLDTLFSGKGSWFTSFESWNTKTDVDQDWARRALRLLVEAELANDDLAEYALALEFSSNSKEAKKFAKSLLKKRSSSLRLYNAYALMECRSGNTSAAEHVWATALSMNKAFADQDKVDTGILWRTWIWESLEARDITRASHLLLALPQQSVDLEAFTQNPTFGATSLLKLNSFLSEAQEHALATRKANVFVAYIDCLAILLYISNPTGLEKSVEAYSMATRRLRMLAQQDEAFKSFTIELLHQSQAKLIYHHTRKGGPYKPSHIRSLLADSMHHYPHNTMFLSLFAWNESRNRIEERVRDVTRGITTTQTRSKYDPSQIQTQQIPVTSHLFSIYTELTRPVYAGSTLHSVRAAFEKAIGDLNPSLSETTNRNRTNTSDTNTTGGTARSNLTLWKLYILFELSRNNTTRAKDIFYRAMRACPWSKELIMLAFTHLRADVVRERFEHGNNNSAEADMGMGFEELRRVYNVLVEKELRVHVDVEEVLDEIAEKRLGKGGAMGLRTGMPFDMPADAESDDEEMQL